MFFVIFNTFPILTKTKIAKRTTKKKRSTLLLFDNIEKIMEGSPKEKGCAFVI
jgi:hypothetical protein